MGYKEELQIDRDQLDTELTLQPSRFMEWSERFAQSQYERDKAKEELEVLAAQIDAEIRMGDKMTEPAIAKAIILDDRYIEAKTRLTELQKNMNILAAAKEAFEHRKVALVKLADLWINQYWSTPKLKGDIGEAIKMKQTEKQLTTLNSNPRLLRRTKSPDEGG